MPKNALVTLRYGPHRSCGVVEHRTFRLEGMQAVLKEDGHQIVLEQTPDWNDVQLIVNGETVFQCNINDLDFEKDHPESPAYFHAAKREALRDLRIYPGTRRDHPWYKESPWKKSIWSPP